MGFLCFALQALAAVLALGNVSFVKASNSSDDACVVSGASADEAGLAARLLGVSSEALATALTSKAITAGRETYTTRFGAAQVRAWCLRACTLLP